jgi:hypothetical protein
MTSPDVVEASAVRNRPRDPAGRYLSLDGRRKPRRPRIGLYSEIGALACLDGRSWQWKFFKAKRAELAAHLGPNLTYVQQQLIERCAWLQLKLTMLDRRLAEDEGRDFTQQDNNIYLAWNNSLARTLALLGVTLGKGIKKPRALRGYKLIASSDGETVADLIGSKP